jgi:eukaryotic-like serine/threonine-protein kinase
MNDISRVEELFLNAVSRVDPAERAAYLDGQCGADVELRNRVEVLLAAQPQAGGFLESPTVEKTRGFVPKLDVQASGTVIAERYTLTDIIGEGGMGTVWRAKQTEPVKRFVALKLIKPGMDSRQVLARFDAERQALAMMDHPNIAKILDGGIHDNRPYFVMELVKGTPITEFCDARRLTPEERLELFLPVCHAIQHAHQKGIIHRDIKPSNVLIALYDDKPVPKVIDFGVAKATGAALTQQTIDTHFGGVVGTPQYMSPEQATFNNLDIDTRSDVYSLGTLLYELLAGSPPFAREELEKRGLMEILRVVREEEPQRPSMKLSTADARASISANRSSEPAKLSQLMKGEIDWIVMKALEKDRTRRYDTANGLAADVRRYLAGETVEACPPTLGYRLRKTYRRNRVAVRIGSAFICLMLSAVAVSSWLAVKARTAETEAKQAMELAEEKQTESEQNLKTSEWYLERYSNAIWEITEDRAKAEVELKSRKIDIALLELQRDSRLGVLLLAATHASDPGEFSLKMPNFINGSTTNTIKLRNVAGYEALNEFITAAVLTTGQEYAPLLPPIMHDGGAIRSCQLSFDARVAMTLGFDGTVRLWDSMTAKPLATLREKDELVLVCGFSPDGTTAITDDMTGVARFWDAATGKLKAKTAGRPERYQRPAEWTYERIMLLGRTGDGFETYGRKSFQIQNHRLLTKRVVFISEQYTDGSLHDTNKLHGPAELWDTKTGKLIAKFEIPLEPHKSDVRLIDDKYLVVIEEDLQVLIYSAEDGRRLARLTQIKNLCNVLVSPSGRRFATVTNNIGSYQLRVWNTEDWQEDVGSSTRLNDPWGYASGDSWEFITDQMVVCDYSLQGLWGTHVYMIGKSDPIGVYAESVLTARTKPDLACLDDGRLFDSRTWKRLVPPAGRKYHPDLVHFAGDQRFVASAPYHVWGERFSTAWIDTRVDKACRSDRERFQETGAYPRTGSWKHRKGFGLVRTVVTFGPEVGQVHVVPTSRLKIPPALLQLWAQVAVRGELGAEGEFVKWNKETWEKKRQELAAAKPPYPDFPFPGYVATDKLHWLRAEYQAAPDKDKLRLVGELLRRAEELGDKNEIIRWRTEREKYPELLPMPREKK